MPVKNGLWYIYILFFTLLIIAISCIPYLHTTFQPESGTLIISGTVKEASTDNPLSGATVVLTGKITAVTVSGAAGYSFTGLPSGTYNIRAYYPGSICIPQSSFGTQGQIELTTDCTDFDHLAVCHTLSSPLTAIHDIQGRSHYSPYNGKRVYNVMGIVTAYDGGTVLGSIDPAIGQDVDDDFIGDYFDVYIQDLFPDDDAATSEGIKLYVHKDFYFNNPNGLTIGDVLLIKEAVVSENDTNPDEYYSEWFTNLSRTQITASISNNNIVYLAKGYPLPLPVIIGANGRVCPAQVCDDAYNGDVNHPKTIFDPGYDAIDFYESLEGMYVGINNAVAIGPTEYNEIVVLPDNGIRANYQIKKTPRGGFPIHDYADISSYRIKIKGIEYPADFDGGTPDLYPGSTFNGQITGVIDYSYGMFQIRATGLPAMTNNVIAAEVTSLLPASDKLTVCSFNVENFVESSADESFSDGKIDGIAETIVTNLQEPDIVGLVEVQDDSGAKMDGIVSCDLVMQKLITSIGTVGGSGSYDYRVINPEYNEDGGQPGGNIRVVFLYNTNRVSFVDRPGGTAILPTSVARNGSEALISFSPGRIEPRHPSFDNSRKSLIGEFLFDGNKIYCIVNHLKSKSGDGFPFGNLQPVIRGSEEKRHDQAYEINGFIRKIISIEPAANIIVLGDFNDYQFSKTLSILKGNELINLIESLPKNEQYTYVHNGHSQVLDHICISNSMTTKNPEIDVVHVFSEFYYQGAFSPPWSDHEPVVARFTF